MARPGCAHIHLQRPAVPAAVRAVLPGSRRGGRGLDAAFDFSLPLGNAKPDSPIHLSEAVFNLLSNPKLLDAVEAIVGPEILLNPVHHVRLKPREALVAGEAARRTHLADRLAPGPGGDAARGGRHEPAHSLGCR